MSKHIKGQISEIWQQPGNTAYDPLKTRAEQCFSQTDVIGSMTEVAVGRSQFFRLRLHSTKILNPDTGAEIFQI